MVLLLVFMQLTRDLFAIAKFLLLVAVENASDDKETKQSGTVPGRFAEYAVDGYTNTTDLSMCASALYDDSRSDRHAWWQVNLGDFYLVTAITAYFPTVRPG